MRAAAGERGIADAAGPEPLRAGAVAPGPDAAGEQVQRVLVGEADGGVDLVDDLGAGAARLTGDDLGRGDLEFGAGEAAGVNETIVEAAGALGVAVLGSVLVASGSFARPMVVATALFTLGLGTSVVVHRRAGGPRRVADLYDARAGEGVP